MKKVNFLILLFTFSAFSQFEYGLKAGINFNGNLNVALDIESLGLGFPTNNYESRSGEHFGLFFKINLEAPLKKKSSWPSVMTLI